MKIFNQQKLSIPIDRMSSLNICVIGVGAVGGYVADSLVKLGCAHLTIVDFDFFEADNFAKECALIDVTADIGCNKAVATAHRCLPRMIDGGNAIGIAADICDFGARFFSLFDIIVCVVDNFSARQHINCMVQQSSPRPILIFAGTSGNFAEAGLLDTSGPCLRCTWDESWLSEATKKRTSCRLDYLVAEQQGSVPTSAFASSMSASLVIQLILSYISGDDTFRNSRLSYLYRPGKIELATTYPIKRNCDDCNLTPPDQLYSLCGDVMCLTMTDTFKQISELLNTTEYSVIPNCSFIISDNCPVCGKEKKVMKPENKLALLDITCQHCRGLSPDNSIILPEALQLIFTPQEFDSSAQSLSLYELGFRIGDIIAVQTGDIFNGSLHFFTCAGDRKLTEQELILI